MARLAALSSSAPSLPPMPAFWAVIMSTQEDSTPSTVPVLYWPTIPSAWGGKAGVSLILVFLVPVPPANSPIDRLICDNSLSSLNTAAGGLGCTPVFIFC